ncbi:MAG: response regulator transcription factor [Deltaproteobacteria bacterium]|nr:MAG: response regulator transcription factor [Deltaproteobacteria bacterium]
MSESALQILVVEDDITLAQSLVQGLREASFEVALANDGESASRRMQQETFDLVILDLMLPGKSGEELLEEWNSRYNVPVIVLTARTELSDRLRCFELGAVDYLPKPFWMEELLVRVRARLHLQEEKPSRLIEWSGVTVNLDARQVNRNDEALVLTRSEFNVLAYLLEREGRAVSRSQIAEHALTVGESRSPRTVDGYIARLRTKLGDTAGACLETVWGIGYRFNTDQNSDAS